MASWEGKIIEGGVIDGGSMREGHRGRAERQPECHGEKTFGNSGAPTTQARAKCSAGKVIEGGS